MTVRNKTKNTILTGKLQKLTTLREKSVGLIGSEEITSVIFQTRFGIHTFGMKRPIDVLILDKTNKVIAVRENLAPNNIFLWNPRYQIVLELPEGTVKKTKTDIGDNIYWS